MALTNYYNIIFCCLFLGSKAWLFGGSPTSVCCNQLNNNPCFIKIGDFNELPLPECFLPVFKLYIRNDQSGIDISSSRIPSQFSTKKQTVILIHGFRDEPDYGNKWMKYSMQNILKQHDHNVIITDWSSNSFYHIWNYDLAASNVRVTARAVADLFTTLYSKGLPSQNTYCVGHSLGAHVCGIASQFLGGYKMFARITGLDPAGPEFRYMGADGRLSKDDASFVDVIHTDGGDSYIADYGMLEPLGHIDFYPNGGQKQPGCSLNKKDNSEEIKETEEQIYDILKRIEKLKKVTSHEIHRRETSDLNVARSDDFSLVELMNELERREKKGLDLERHISKGSNYIKGLLEDLRQKSSGKRGGIVGCSHGRATDYYIVSITTRCFTSTAKCSYFHFIPNSCNPCTGVCPVMGYYADENKLANGVYYLATNPTGNAPYCP